MPYAGATEEEIREKKRANEKRRRAETNEDFRVQANRLMKKLRAAFERNEEQREQGITERSLEPKPKKATLEKYGIEVFLKDTAMFDLNTQNNKNQFIQVRRPQWKENFNRDPQPEPAPEPQQDTLVQLIQVKNALDKKQINDAKESTILKRWRDFKNIVQESGCENIVTWFNNGKWIEYINKKTEVRNTRMGYFKAFYFVVKHDLLAGITDEAKAKMEEASQDIKDTVKYHQLNQWEIENIRHIKPFSQYLIELEMDNYHPLSNEMVLMKVYDELTARDDFGDIKLYFDDPGKVEDCSYYVMATGEIHFNGWKKTGTTGNKSAKSLYKPKYFKHEFSDDLKLTLLNYTVKHGGSKLFLVEPRKILQSIGTNVQTLRIAKVREVYDDENITMEERKKKAYDMFQSWATQLIYAGRMTRSGKRYG